MALAGTGQCSSAKEILETVIFFLIRCFLEQNAVFTGVKEEPWFWSLQISSGNSVLHDPFSCGPVWLLQY